MGCHTYIHNRIAVEASEIKQQAVEHCASQVSPTMMQWLYKNAEGSIDYDEIVEHERYWQKVLAWVKKDYLLDATHRFMGYEGFDYIGANVSGVELPIGGDNLIRVHDYPDDILMSYTDALSFVRRYTDKKYIQWQPSSYQKSIIGDTAVFMRDRPTMSMLDLAGLKMLWVEYPDAIVSFG